jgi:lipopolysaccharide/colanic/teichoic acid biosynthesis glycosyltransferase
VRRLVTTLFPVGAIVIAFATGTLHARWSPVPYTFGTVSVIASYLCFSAVHVGAAFVAGIPDEPDDVQPALAAAVLSSAFATAAWLLIQTVFPPLLPRRGALAMATWSFVCALLVVRSLRRTGSRERVIVVAGSSDIRILELDALRTFPQLEAAFALVAAVSIDDLVMTAVERFRHALDINEPSVVVFSEAATLVPELVDQAIQLHRGGVRVRTLGEFYEEYFGKVALTELSKLAMMFDVRTLHHPTYRRLKRLGDVLGAVVGLVVLPLLVPIVFAGNLLANRGRLLFFQERIGRNGTTFRMVKFRTMREVEGESSKDWTATDDPRITPFGRVLRKSHLDELPQLWNVLTGELSLIGPRPEQPHFVVELSAKEPSYQLRHLVPPGLTGWAQIKLRYAATDAAAIEKLQYDLYYLRHQSFALDLRILSRTARSVLRRQGR